jgi:hypothetical protein
MFIGQLGGISNFIPQKRSELCVKKDKGALVLFHCVSSKKDPMQYKL